MADYALKLSSIALKKQKLMAEEKKLVEKRKQEIARLIEHFDLLTTSDELMVGLLSELKIAITEKSEKVKFWEHQGGQILKSKKPLTKN